MMKARSLALFLVTLALLMAAFVACGPATAPASDGGASDDAAAEPTETPEPTEPPTATPWPTKPPSTPWPLPPTKTPEPVTPEARPVEPAHPNGLEGCKSVGAFRDEGDMDYRDWCSDELIDHVVTTCRSKTDTAAQRQCGENIVNQYNSFLFRDGVIKCVGISSSGEREDCAIETADGVEKALTKIFEAWDKVLIGASADADVGKAMEEVVSCLEDEGFDDVDKDLLFNWQQMYPPAEVKVLEDALSDSDKALREEMAGPSRACAKKNGLFEAQEAAWSAELTRLNDEEPETVEHLIREGLQDALDKPGIAVFLSGEPSE